MDKEAEEQLEQVLVQAKQEKETSLNEELKGTELSENPASE